MAPVAGLKPLRPVTRQRDSITPECEEMWITKMRGGRGSGGQVSVRASV
jgi:hypothetical protein